MNDTNSERRLRVLALGFRGFPGVQGGIETHAEQLYVRLQKLGCDVEAVVRTPYQPVTLPATWNGIRFRPLWAPRSQGLEAGLHTLLGFLYAIVRRPDVIHVHGVGPAFFTPLARIFNLPVVVTHHGPDYEREKWGQLARLMLKTGERAGMLAASERIAISDTIRGLIADRYGVAAEVIRNGVTLPELAQGTDRLVQFGLAAGHYILCVGRLVPEKRHIDLIDAFAKAAIPDCKLAIVGGTDTPDPYVRRVVAHAAQVPGVVCTGFQTGLALAQLFAHAGMFVLPSSHEGLPIALLEALSYGLRVAASDIPAHRECPLGDEAYFPVGNVGRLVEAMRAGMAAIDSVRDRTARRALVADMCNWDVLARATLAVLERAAFPGAARRNVLRPPDRAPDPPALAPAQAVRSTRQTTP